MDKTANVLNKLPESLQAKDKGHLQDVWMAETRVDAEYAFDFFVEAYGAKYDKAVECPARDRDRSTADLLRRSGRALEARAIHQPHRKHLRHGPPQDDQDQGLPVP